jgi:hypothetical protein
MKKAPLLLVCRYRWYNGFSAGIDSPATGIFSYDWLSSDQAGMTGERRHGG